MDLVAGTAPHRHVDARTALAETQRAFDGIAPAYHQSNVDNVLLDGMRRRFRGAVARHIPREARLLDLGCGPGTDEVWLAAQGYRVTAIDWSASMVREARDRIRGHGMQDRVEVRHLGIHELDRLAPATFDAVCSNFGPLNCVSDLAASAASIAARVRPRGMLVASVIGRVCPWEIALYAARLDWRRIAIRFERGLTPVPLEGRAVWTQYFSPSAFERVFVDAGFEPLERRALGLCVPPPYLRAFAERHRRFVSALEWLDDAIGAWPGMRELGDHFLVAMRRR